MLGPRHILLVPSFLQFVSRCRRTSRCIARAWSSHFESHFATLELRDLREQNEERSISSW